MITQKSNRTFIFGYFFEKYKDYPVASRDSFRNYFLHKHGKYVDLELLIRAIEVYQMEKYNQTLQGYMDHTRETRKGGR